MKESYLHFVWETRSFNGEAWKTTDGQPVKIIDPGKVNSNQGPDFLNARVEIDGLEHRGHIEIHVDARDWYRHGHQYDPHSNAVILHVVLEHGGSVLRQDGTDIPEVSLKNRIYPGVLHRIDQFADKRKSIPCGRLLGGMPGNVRIAWLRKLAAERLAGKIDRAKDRLNDFAADWEQVIWEELAAFIAGPVNQEAFRTLAKRLPIKVLRRYQQSEFQREALLFGAAATLTGRPRDEYHGSLQGEWRYLSSLHQLEAAPILLKMHRMRPGNFPTLRLSQLGALISHHQSLINLLQPKNLYAFPDLEVHASPYWKSHLSFGSTSNSNRIKLGPTTLKVILLNCLIPLAILYAQAHGLRELEGIVRTLPRQLNPENNRFIRNFRAMGLVPDQAEEGQALISLYKHYCQKKRCLECQFGKYILNQ